MTNSEAETIEAATSITEEEFDRISEAFWDGTFVGLVGEHEGSSQTLLFEVPHGHIGLTVCVTPSDGDIHLRVDEWQREPHHEVEDRWVWVRA